MKAARLLGICLLVATIILITDAKNVAGGSSQPVVECDTVTFRQCLEDYLFPFNTAKMNPCLQETNCLEYCSATTSIAGSHFESLYIDGTGSDVPEETQECYINIYMSHLDKCDWVLSEFDVCYPDPTAERTKECQDEIYDCMATGNTDTMNDCMQNAWLSFGYSTCSPCLVESQPSAKDLVKTEGGLTFDWNCIAGCYRDFLQNCDQTGYSFCQMGCLNVTNRQVEGNPIENTETSSFSLSEGAIILLILGTLGTASAFLVSRRKNGQIVDDEDRMYEKFIA